MFGSRTYPLTPECRAVTSERTVARRHYGVPVDVVSSLIDSGFETYEAAHKARPAEFGRLKATLDEIEANMNAERAEEGLAPISMSINRPDDCHCFQYVPTVEGIQIHLRHWGPAPTYPAGATIGELLRSKNRFARRHDVFSAHGAVRPLKNLRIPKSAELYQKILDAFDGSPALTITDDALVLRYFPIEPEYPVLRRPDDITGRYESARGRSDAEQKASAGVTLSVGRMERDWARRATAERHHGHIHREDWGRIRQFDDGRWGTEIKYWRVDPTSRAMTVAERDDMDERLERPVGAVVTQEQPMFGLFLHHTPGFNQTPDADGEEGSGRPMGY